MMEVKVCKDIFKYKESILMGLNLRQVICSFLAIGVAVGLYFLLKVPLGKETASWMCIVGASPFAVAGFFTYNGLTVEKFISEWFFTTFVSNGERHWVGENKYYEIWRKLENDKNTKKTYFKRAFSRKHRG